MNPVKQPGYAIKLFPTKKCVMGQINRRTWRFDSDICAGLSTEYQDLSTRHDWPVKRAIVRLANQRGVEFIRSPELGSHAVSQTLISSIKTGRDTIEP